MNFGQNKDWRTFFYVTIVRLFLYHGELFQSSFLSREKLYSWKINLWCENVTVVKVKIGKYSYLAKV